MGENSPVLGISLFYYILPNKYYLSSTKSDILCLKSSDLVRY